MRHLPFPLTPAHGLLAPGVAAGSGEDSGLLGPVPPHPGAGVTPSLQAARVALELWISSSGRRHPRPWGDEGVSRLSFSTYRSPIRPRICSSLEGEINLDVADLEHQVTCSQL